MTSTDSQQGRLEQRIERLFATDRQFADARPVEAIAEAAERPGLRLSQIVQTVMEGYADRPALGQRETRPVEDPGTGRTSLELLPSFATITYGQAWERARAITTALSGDPVGVGDRVCVLGFASIDYTVIDLALVRLGAVAIPLANTASQDRLQPIVAETAPVLLAAGLDSLDSAVELALAGSTIRRLVVFDYHPEADDERETFEAARARLTAAGSSVALETLQAVVERGRAQPEAPAAVTEQDDAPALLIYTSGSTGLPKGAIYPEPLVSNFWRRAGAWLPGTTSPSGSTPSIVLGFMPMSHLMGRVILYTALRNGGTAYFAAKSDLSTLLEDLALVRPTSLDFVPRIWEMLFQHYQSQLHRRTADGPGAQDEVLADMRQNVLGGRFVSALTGSAPISPELKAWVEALTDVHLTDGYGATEIGMVLRDGRITRPPVLEYKLLDVPDLGYFTTDRPHPRGELAVKSAYVFGGYYNRPEVTASVFDEDGFYHTGDIVAETEPEHLTYLDRRNFVLKLSQGEFVTVSRLESVFVESPLISQIYVYGNSARTYLLAVVVPTADALADAGDAEALKPAISRALRDIGKAKGLQSYEIPRDFLVETTPFSLENGLLTDIRKLARPKLKQRYAPLLEELYQELAEAETGELQTLRQSGADQPVLDTILQAVGALLGASADELRPESRFTELGGDSLSGLTFANLLRDIFGVEISAGVLVSPANDLRSIAAYIEKLRAPGAKRPTFSAVHGQDSGGIRAADLKLDKFLDAGLLAAAPNRPRAATEPRTVLLTGATGFLGRYLALHWLERLSTVDGKLVCLVRAKDDAAARQRLDDTFDSGDPELLAHYRSLAEGHLEVLAADKGEPNLGLDQDVWQRLADTVDWIVDPAAMVNHVLGYDQLFGPNVVGTAELIRLALTTRLKPYTYVSTLGVGEGMEPSAFVEQVDVREASPVRRSRESYASGYADSKWAGEVLLREANDLCGLPVSVFRCDMIMADTRYAGQLNVPDMFTRTMFSLAATGVAPDSFYRPGPGGERPRAHYDGLPVDFIAEAITTIGTQVTDGFETYHVANPHDDGISMDTYVDWLVEAGYRIERIAGYDAWLRRFEAALRNLPEQQRHHSLLPLIHNYQQPMPVTNTGMGPAEHFRAAVQQANIPPDKDIPHITPAVIVKYLSNLQLLGLL
ncbi:carboxylic acid reductase [Amycolatopsis sp. PS_44_ISF1]|uniref:carboxylic acid reductase n=1 Tax=Amycolatopsis sp. PS_44_ISF1 TaxID=2974917 RepID=UPI0028DF529B|nr:carboxylic acid reductase [Amycolatopsis sp. PS_44_ISF1]MDT8915905.1 carboxylic acid reductase [Amycolatopsis sp. PS_44_ISF1]